MVMTVAVVVAILFLMNATSAAMPSKEPEELSWNVRTAVVLAVIFLVVAGLDLLYLRRLH